MKYTNYIINGDAINARALENVPKIFLPLTLSAAIFGVVILAGIIPMTVALDGLRTVKYGMVKFERKHHYGQIVVDSKAFKFAVIRPINVVVVNPIHNVLKFVA